jgi:GR25 family glycosyltransferase involved in LPS biosynthesis
MPFTFNDTNTFCITVEPSITNRWSRMEIRLKEAGLDSVCKWKASRPQDLQDQFDSRLSQLQCACAQSHINIYKHIVKHNLEYAFILEDDACFDKDWLEKLMQFTSQDDTFDALFLNCSEPENPQDTWVKCKNQYLTGAYIISLQGANRILTQFQDCYYSADWMTSRLQENDKSYTYFPWLVIQEGLDTTIESGYEADQAKVIRCLDEIGYPLTNYGKP